jgi:hypothetical protein
LHVLSAPPAFVLSQDQTLREEVVAGSKAGDPLTLSLVLKGRPARGKREGDEVLMSSPGTKPAEVLDTRRTFAAEFSKTSAVPIDVRHKKASDSRQRPPWKRFVSDTSRAGRLLSFE